MKLNPATILMQGRPEDEVFTFHDAEDDTYHHFNASALIRCLSSASFTEWRMAGVKWGVTDTPREWIKSATASGKRYFEEARVAQLCEPHMYAPVVLVTWLDGSTVMIDGTHRVIRADRDGRDQIACVIVPYHVANRFRIDLPGKGTFEVERPRTGQDDALARYLKSKGVV